MTVKGVTCTPEGNQIHAVLSDEGKYLVIEYNGQKPWHIAEVPNLLQAGDFVSRRRAGFSFQQVVDHVNSVYAVRHRPPERARFLLNLCLSRPDGEYLIGDLEEEYQTIILPEFGLRRAKLWYWKQVIWSIWPMIGSRVRRILAVGGIAKAAYEIYKRLRP